MKIKERRSNRNSKEEGRLRKGEEIRKEEKRSI